MAKFTLSKKWVYKQKEILCDLWVEMSKDPKLDIPEYQKIKIANTPGARPIDEFKALLKQFGSGTLGIEAEFWLERAKTEFFKRVKTINDK